MSIFSWKNLIASKKEYKQNKRYLDNNYKGIGKGIYNKFVTLFNGLIIKTNDRIKKLVYSLFRNNKNLPAAIMKLFSQNMHFNII